MTALLCVLVEKDGFQNKYIFKRLLSLPLPYQRNNTETKISVMTRALGIK